MSLVEITCCHGGPHTVECNYCSHSPRYVPRREIQIEHTRQLARSVTFPAGESRETCSGLLEDGPASERNPGAACHAAGSRAGARGEE